MAGEVRRKQKGESAMSYKIVLQPGELNDANRDYLPKAIKGSRMVVNENGNNSQVYPARLTEHVEDILGEDNFAFYTGEKADLVYLDIKNRDHGQALDEAFYCWNYMFSGVRRAPDGTLVKEKTIWEPVGDSFALALTYKSQKAWFHNAAVEMPVRPVLWQKLKYHGLDGGQMVRGAYLCASLRFLAEIFGARYETDEDGLEATLTLKDGRTVKVSRGVIGCLVDDNMVAMYCEALHREGELLVSVEWFCRFLFNMNVSVCNGVVYATDHFAELSTFMAEIIQEQLV